MRSRRRFSEGQGEMGSLSHGENVRPVRARTRDVKREERESRTSLSRSKTPSSSMRAAMRRPRAKLSIAPAHMVTQLFIIWETREIYLINLIQLVKESAPVLSTECGRLAAQLWWRLNSVFEPELYNSCNATQYITQIRYILYKNAV